MNKKQRKQGNANQPLWIISLLCGGIGLGITLVSALVFPVLMLKTGDPNSLASAFSAISLLLGGAVGAFLAVNKSKVFAAGMLSGAVILVPIAAASLFIGGASGVVDSLLTVGALAASCGIGGYLPFFIQKSGKSKVKKIKKQRARR